MQVWNVLHAARWKYRTHKWCKKSPSAPHHTTLSGYVFAIKARINNQKKNLLSNNISHTCPYNMVNFGPLAAEIVSLVWGTPANFNGFHILAALLHSQTAASNRGRHLYSAGRPSRWALAHISSCIYICVLYSPCVPVDWATVSMTRVVNPVHLVPVVGKWQHQCCENCASDWRKSDAVRDWGPSLSRCDVSHMAILFCTIGATVRLCTIQPVWHRQCQSWL